MRRYYVLLFAFILLALWFPAQVDGQEPLQVTVLAVGVNSNQVAVDFQVKNGSGRGEPKLKPQDGAIIEYEEGENAAAATTITLDGDQLNRRSTDKNSPALKLTLSDGKSYDLAAASATIGIVFDAVERLR